MALKIELSEIPVMESLAAGSLALVSYGSGIARLISTAAITGSSQPIPWSGASDGKQYRLVVVLTAGNIPALDLQEI